MVENFNFEKLAGADQVACHLNVGFGWRGFPAWVIVCEHNGVGGGHNGQPEHFAGVYQNRILRADANQIMPFDAAAGIEHEHNEAFTLGVDRCFILQLMVLVLNCVSCFASGSSQSPVAMVARKSNRRVDFALFLL